ncbi:hypothetical protein ACMA5I_11460 [Paracoccaceae bacterium GXU_MW_L88]
MKRLAFSLLPLMALAACAQPELDAEVPERGGQTITVVDNIGFTVTQEPYGRIIVASDEPSNEAQAGAAAEIALPAFCQPGQALILDDGRAMREAGGRTLWSFKGDCT